MTAQQNLLKRMFDEKFGRLPDEYQAEFKAKCKADGLFETNDEWLDALDIYFDEVACEMHYRQLYA